MILFNYEEGNHKIICDTVQFELINEQLFFLDPQFIGFNIGGREQKELWLDSLVDRAIVYETVIKFDD